MIRQGSKAPAPPRIQSLSICSVVMPLLLHEGKICHHHPFRHLSFSKNQMSVMISYRHTSAFQETDDCLSLAFGFVYLYTNEKSVFPQYWKTLAFPGVVISLLLLGSKSVILWCSKASASASTFQSLLLQDSGNCCSLVFQISAAKIKDPPSLIIHTSALARCVYCWANGRRHAMSHTRQACIRKHMILSEDSHLSLVRRWQSSDLPEGTRSRLILR